MLTHVAGDWGEELDNALRGITGGYLLGIPLIYTMETWWIGETISMPRALAFIAIAYIVTLGFVTVTGFRGQIPGSRHPLTEALESLALAIVATTAILWLLNQIGPGLPADVVIGRIAVDVLPICLGIGVTNLILAPRETRLGEGDDGDGQDSGESTPGKLSPVLLDAGASFAGALFIAVSIAPTEEIPMLATELPSRSLPILIIFSLLLTYAIVFEAGFGGIEQRRTSTGPFQRPVTETVLAYVIALATCAAMLLLYGQIDGTGSWWVSFNYIVILGLPAAIGAAAGRLAV